MEELVAGRSDAFCEHILSAFSAAHGMGMDSTGNRDHGLACVGLDERRIPLLGKLQRFRDQGEAMCRTADMLFELDREKEAATYYQRARDVGAAHGFFSLESKACR
jgi:hypothetical protein